MDAVCPLISFLQGLLPTGEPHISRGTRLPAGRSKINQCNAQRKLILMNNKSISENQQHQPGLTDLPDFSRLISAATAQLDDCNALALLICAAPSAAITIAHQGRHSVASATGLPDSACECLLVLCEQTLTSRDYLVIPDTRKDKRYRDDPLFLQAPAIRFYAGVPLMAANGEAIGTLAVTDEKPRQLTAGQEHAMRTLSRHVMALLESCRQTRAVDHVVAEGQRAAQALPPVQEDRASAAGQPDAACDDAEAVLQGKDRESRVLNDLVNSLPGMFYMLDENGRFLRWNDNFMRITGYTAKDVARAHPLDFFGPQERPLLEQKIQAAFTTGHAQVEATLCTRHGERIPHLFNAARVQIDGKTCIAGMGIDITERKQFEASLQEAEERYRQLLELSPDAILVMKNDHCTFANRAGLRLLGAVTQEQLADRSLLELIHPDCRQEFALRIGQLEQQHPQDARFELKFIQFDGTVIDVALAAACFSDEGVPARLLVVRDISESQRQKELLEHQANYDDLTQLANRHLLDDRIRQAIAYADRSQTMATLAFIDLDNFKLINDSLGHNIGDHLLVSVAERLRQCVRDGDTVARHGGDEFVLVLYNHENQEAIAAWIGRLMERFSHPFTVAEHQLFITCSIGLSIYPRDGGDVQSLLKHADAAMYQAKAHGRNQFQFFIPSMNQRVRERFNLENKLRQALDREEFVLYYQPQVELASGNIIGAEALIRWMEPELGMQSPLKFIPVAEETGLIVPIGQWVLEQACRQNKLLQDTGFAGMTVSVNLSPRQFSPVALIESVQSTLRRAGLAASLLKLEVTESTVMSRPEEAEEILRELKRIGVLLAIDDFGIGYSSLSYLQRFPMDQLKIDQSFVQRVADDANDAAITQAVISLGHSLNLRVVAEGVCSKKQLSFLRMHACDEIQGNYFCKAIPFDQLQQLLATRQQALSERPAGASLPWQH